MAENETGAAQSAPILKEQIKTLQQSNKSQEKTIADLKKQIADENSPSQDEQIQTLMQANKAQEKNIKDLQKENADLQKELSDARDELKDAADIIEDLKSQPKGEDNKGKTVTIDKKKYLVTGGFRGKDKNYLPEDIAADKELAKKLIEKGSGLIKEVS